jgi:hypothetical protein
MSDLQKQEIYDQLYEGYRVYKSDSALVLLEKYANRNQSERFKSTRSSGTEPRLHHGNFGMYKEATDILVKPWQSVPRVKGSYYVVNRVLYSYMYDYATSVYEKRKYAALTQNIEIHHYSISPNSRDNTSLFKRNY